MKYIKKTYFFLLATFCIALLSNANEAAITPIKNQEKLKIYFSAKLAKPEYQAINSKISKSIFNDKYEVFLPQDVVIPKLNHAAVEKCTYHVDREAIDWADIVFLLSPYGKDCSWEIGYAKGKKKFIVGFLQDKNSIQDSMVIGSLDIIVTDDKEIMDALKKNTITAYKSIFANKLENIFDSIVTNYYNKDKFNFCK